LPDCSMQEKTAIYRIFDEVLSNVLTHAKTKSVSVRIAVRDNYFFADIRDNGQGFDVQQALHGNTTGLQTMFERVTLLNGELNIHSIIGDGSQITITIPVEIDSQEKITSPQQIAKKPDPISQPTSISKVRVLIADDHDIMRHGLQQIINQDDKLHVIKHATIRSELFNSGHQQEIDLILLDIDMEDSGGFNVIKELRQQLPKCHIMALSHHKQAVYAVEAIQSGANGYLLKDTTSIEIIHAIHKVASGEQYICEAIADEVFEWMLNARSTTGTVTNLYNLLTEREREIMLLVLAGSTSADIAEQLTISPRTVEKHRSNFMSKLGLKTPTQLVKFASEQGLIS
ncbi:MAG: response regulator, partial [Chloroflexota bacterium]